MRTVEPQEHGGAGAPWPLSGGRAEGNAVVERDGQRVPGSRGPEIDEVEGE